MRRCYSVRGHRISDNSHSAVSSEPFASLRCACANHIVESGPRFPSVAPCDRLLSILPPPPPAAAGATLPQLPPMLPCRCCCCHCQLPFGHAPPASRSREAPAMALAGASACSLPLRVVTRLKRLVFHRAPRLRVHRGRPYAPFAPHRCTFHVLWIAERPNYGPSGGVRAQSPLHFGAHFTSATQ